MRSIVHTHTAAGPSYTYIKQLLIYVLQLLLKVCQTVAVRYSNFSRVI